MELGSIIGLVGGVLAMAFTVISSGIDPAALYDTASVFMTIGGSFCALLINHSLSRVLALFGIIGRIFKVINFGEQQLMSKLMQFSEKARREGLLALEDELEDLDDEFLKKGLRMVVDGTDAEVIRNLMENELNQMEARHASWCKILDDWSKLAPGFGMLGTVMGLIGMMRNLEDKSRIGPNMAVALITTFYGAIMANFLLIPIKGKLEGQNAAEMLVREMTIEGVISIQAGENPHILKQKLLAFVTPAMRKQLETEFEKE
jgi:chemotaxis protein MotA